METGSQQKNRKLSKGVKIIVWGLAIILVVLATIGIGGWYMQKNIPAKLKAAVYEKSQGQYSLAFDKMNVSLLSGTVDLENAKLTIDTQAYLTHLSPESSDNLVQLKVRQLKFSGISFYQYLMKEKIILKEILIDKPEIVLYQMRDTIRIDSVAKSLYDQVPDFLKGIKLDLIKVNELAFSKRKFAHLQDSVNKLTGLSFSMEGVSIDSSAMRDTSLVWFSKDIKIHSTGLKYTLANGLYFLKLEKLNASTKSRTLDIEAFKVIPLYKEIEFSHKLGKQGDRYNILVPFIQIKDIDFKKLETENKLFSQSILLENGQVLVFNNKKLPSDMKDVILNAPHLALQRLEFPVLIDTLTLKNFEVHYRELNPKSNQIGDAFFTNLNGTLKNITNDSVSLMKNNWCVSNFEMNFLGNAKIDLNLNFNLTSKIGEFNYKGTLGAANATSFNKLLEPIALVKADKGYFNKISFDVKANINGSHGTVQALYKDLKVSALVKEPDGSLGKDGLISFLVNALFVTPNNPEEGEVARTSNFTYTHSPKRSFFNLMWKSIFTGIKDNVIESKEEKKEKKKLEKEKKKEIKEAKKEAKKT